jgi:hypothetical protein
MTRRSAPLYSEQTIDAEQLAIVTRAIDRMVAKGFSSIIYAS